jgi:hypothetical protein
MRGNSKLRRFASQIPRLLGNTSTNYLGVGAFYPFSEGGSIHGLSNISKLTAQFGVRVIDPMLRPVVRHCVLVTESHAPDKPRLETNPWIIYHYIKVEGNQRLEAVAQISDFQYLA